MHFRHEHKHVINYADMLLLQKRLSLIMPHDENADDDGAYTVKSLYFDNYADTALREKLDGVNCREKFRIRYYGNDTGFIRLEKKSKINGLCNKVSARISADECQRIIDGDTGFLLSSQSELLREFYAKRNYRLLRPKCIVAYRREGFVFPTGNVRVTLDSEISSSINVRQFLNPDLTFTRLYRNDVLEVKWDEFLPKVIQDAVQLQNRRASAFSKYAAVRL